MITVNVFGGNCEQAIRNLKKTLQLNLVYRKLKMAAAYESPSQKRARKAQESARRRNKNLYRKRIESE